MSHKNNNNTHNKFNKLYNYIMYVFNKNCTSTKKDTFILKMSTKYIEIHF